MITSRQARPDWLRRADSWSRKEAMPEGRLPHASGDPVSRPSQLLTPGANPSSSHRDAIAMVSEAAMRGTPLVLPCRRDADLWLLSIQSASVQVSTGTFPVDRGRPATMARSGHSENPCLVHFYTGSTPERMAIYCEVLTSRVTGASQSRDGLVIGGHSQRRPRPPAVVTIPARRVTTSAWESPVTPSSQPDRGLPVRFRSHPRTVALAINTGGRAMGR